MAGLLDNYLANSIAALRRAPSGLLGAVTRHSPDRIARGLLGPAYDPAVAIPNYLGPGADVKMMVEDATQVIPAVRRGDYADALSSLGMAGAAIPFMAVPGTVKTWDWTSVRPWHKGPKFTAEQAEDIINSRNKTRRNWGAERKQFWKDNIDDYKTLVRVRGEANPQKRESALRLKQLDAVRHNLEKWDHHQSDPLLKAARVRSFRAEARRKASPILEIDKSGLWNKSFKNEIAREAEHQFGWRDFLSVVNRANMEAVPRQLKKEGWKMRHASKVKSGKKSSRYLVSPDGEFEVRLSDHYLPDKPERAYNQAQFGTRWDDEIVLSGNENPQDVIDQIKELWKEWLD